MPTAGLANEKCVVGAQQRGRASHRDNPNPNHTSPMSRNSISTITSNIPKPHSNFSPVGYLCGMAMDDWWVAARRNQREYKESTSGLREVSGKADSCYNKSGTLKTVHSRASAREIQLIADADLESANLLLISSSTMSTATQEKSQSRGVPDVATTETTLTTLRQLLK